MHHAAVINGFSLFIVCPTESIRSFIEANCILYAIIYGCIANEWPMINQQSARPDPINWTVRICRVEFIDENKFNKKETNKNEMNMKRCMLQVWITFQKCHGLCRVLCLCFFVSLQSNMNMANWIHCLIHCQWNAFASFFMFCLLLFLFFFSYWKLGTAAVKFSPTLVPFSLLSYDVNFIQFVLFHLNWSHDKYF